MRFLSALRTSGALWFIPFAFGLESLYIRNESVFSGYLQSDYADAATFGVYPVGPLLAALAALKFRGTRRYHLSAPRARSGSIILLRSFAPLLIGGGLAVVAAMALSVQAWPRDMRTLAILGVAFMTIIACGMVGIAAARLLPTVAAVPLVAGVTFWWIAITPTQNDALLAHLSPDMPCCAIDAQLSTTYLVGYGLLVTGVAVGLFGTFVGRGWSAVRCGPAAFVTVIVIAASVGASASIVRASDTPANRVTTEARTTALKCEKVDELSVCVWPEQTRVAGPAAEQIERLNTHLASWRLPRVSGVRQQRPHRGEIELRTPSPTFAGIDEVRLFIAAGYVAREAECSEGLHGDRPADERVAALMLAMGTAPSAPVLSDIPPVAVRSAQIALAMTDENFEAWFREALDDVSCSERQ